MKRPKNILIDINTNIDSKSSTISATDTLADLDTNADSSAPDYYYNETGLMVFTRAYHLKRGYYCKSGCRHCPFDFKK